MSNAAWGRRRAWSRAHRMGRQLDICAGEKPRRRLADRRRPAWVDEMYRTRQLPAWAPR